MRSNPKPHNEYSPLTILADLAVEGTSSMVEAQRAVLNLAQQENEIILNGVKERLGFVPAVAMTDLVRRSLDTLIGMQQELLTTTSKQTLEWLEAEKAGKNDRAARLVEFAREGVDAFTHAQTKFLEAVAQESTKATSGKQEHDVKITKKEIAHLAREAANAFIEAQKRLLDVMGQQMNVQLEATTRAMGFISPTQLMPMASLTGEGVKQFFDAERSLISSLVTPPKKVAAHAKHGKGRTVRHKVAV